MQLDSASPHALSDYIAQLEFSLYGRLVADVFGFHALQYGTQAFDLLSQSRIPHKHYVADQSWPSLNVLAESEYLPFAEASIDLVCFPHTLEQCAYPQQSLREIYRILVADGTVVLTGITPVSILGLLSRVSDCHGLGSMQRQFTAWRIRDWLGVLGFEVVEAGYCCHAIPINDARWLQRQGCLEHWGKRTCGMTGGIYYIVAKKRVINVRLLKPEWKSTRLTQALPARKAQSSSQKQ